MPRYLATNTQFLQHVLEIRESEMLNRRILIAVIVLSLFLLIVVYNSAYFMRWKILNETPVGTKSDQVLLYCAHEKLNCLFSETAGYVNQDSNKVVGVKSVRAKLNDRKIFPFVTTTTVAYWGFDKDRRLLDICVWRTFDAL